MKHSFTGALAIFALTLAACGGNFSTGTDMPSQPIPQVAQSMQPYGQNGNPEPLGSINPSSSPGVSTAASYAIADAPAGFDCPATLEGYMCNLRFNLPPPTPTPSPGAKSKVTPSPTPSPTATPTPEPTGSQSPAASPSPSASPTPAVSLKAEALPKDAPPMYHTPIGSLSVVPLMMVQLSPTADFPLAGGAVAQFTLPKEQTAQRAFAVQLFQVSTSKKHTNYKPIWTFDKSTLKDQTLRFDFIPPKVTIPKNATYVLVLYGNEQLQSPAPSGSPSAQPSSASASPAASASPEDVTPVPSPA